MTLCLFRNNNHYVKAHETIFTLVKVKVNILCRLLHFDLIVLLPTQSKRNSQWDDCCRIFQSKIFGHYILTVVIKRKWIRQNTQIEFYLFPPMRTTDFIGKYVVNVSDVQMQVVAIYSLLTTSRSKPRKHVNATSHTSLLTVQASANSKRKKSEFKTNKFSVSVFLTLYLPVLDKTPSEFTSVLLKVKRIRSSAGTGVLLTPCSGLKRLEYV